MEIGDLRNLRAVRLSLDPGLNVFLGRNAQGKTTLLEAVAVLARGRSFRTEDVRSLECPGGYVSAHRISGKWQPAGLGDDADYSGSHPQPG